MSKWNEFDAIGEKIIFLLNKMTGISTVLAAVFATIVLGAKKDLMHPILYIMGLVAVFLTVVVFRGYLHGIISLIPKDEKKTKKWIVFASFIAGLMSCVPYATIFVITHSFL